MNFIEMLDAALRLAETAHEGQVDKAGRPYFEHVSYVAAQGIGDEKIVGALHDVVEDTTITLAFLVKIFPIHIVQAVDAITKRKGELYEDYLKRVKMNTLARQVKLYDLDHNMDLSRLAVISPADNARVFKYQQAKEFLLAE